MKRKVAVDGRVIFAEYVRKRGNPFDQSGGTNFVHLSAVPLPAAETVCFVTLFTVFHFPGVRIHADRYSGFCMEGEETHGTVCKQIRPILQTAHSDKSFICI